MDLWKISDFTSCFSLLRNILSFCCTLLPPFCCVLLKWRPFNGVCRFSKQISANSLFFHQHHFYSVHFIFSTLSHNLSSICFITNCVIVFFFLFVFNINCVKCKGGVWLFMEYFMCYLIGLLKSVDI